MVRYQRLIIPSVTVLMGWVALPAHAQVQPPAVAPAAAPADQSPNAADPGTGSSSDAERHGVADIVVTAQKRGENIQRVPIAISAVTAASLQATGTSSAADLQQIVPGLKMDTKQAVVQPFIRGIGVSTNTPGLESSVATYVDGVYSASAVASNFAFSSIERIEVLKGPQGTLFGRNASAGVISVYTRDPSATQEIDADIGYGNFDTISGHFYGTTGIAKDVSANLAMVYSNQRDGWGYDSYRNQDVRLGKSFALRGKIKVDLDSETKLLLSGWYNSSSSDYGAFAILPGTVPNGGIPQSSQSGWWDTRTFAQNTKNKQHGVALRVEHDLGFADLVDIAAYQRVDPFVSIAVIRTGLNIDWTEKTFTNELQLVSKNSYGFVWVAGFFYLHSDLSVNQTSIGLLPVSPASIVASTLGTSSIAPFGQASYDVSSKFRITAGVRYTQDKRHFTGSTSNAAGVVMNSVDANKDFGQLSWRGSLEFKPAERILTYLSYNRGFKAGVYSSTSPTSPPIKPEIVDHYELGAKSEFFDRVVRLNGAAFYYNYNNLTLRAITPGTPVPFLTNAGKARIKGVDVDVQIAPGGGFQISGGIEYLDAKYTELLSAVAYTPRRDALGNLLPGNITLNGVDLTGNTLLQAPKLSGNVDFSYTTRLLGGTTRFSSNISYVSKHYLEADNRIAQNGFALMSGSIRWDSPNDRYSVTTFAKNIFNKKYIQDVAAASDFDPYVPGAPRTFGIQFGVKFGG